MTLQTFQLPFDVSLLPVKRLSAGLVKCGYENGNLRYIHLGGREVVRMIYSAVRNENWETASYQIADEVIEEKEGGFFITYNAFYRLNEIRYKAFIEIEGKDDSISFSMKGVALTSFQSNRIGICVLHPINTTAGKNVGIKQPDGSSYEGVFPVHISPHQPFKQVQQMQWQIEDALEAKMTFEGDIFETEDQRNWTDASYKNYSRPLDLPFPYGVQVGEEIHQKVTLNISGYESIGDHITSAPTSAEETVIPFPKIGYSRPKGLKPLTDKEIKLLKEIPFDHYRVELWLNEQSWPQIFSTALFEAKELSAKLELIVFFDNEVENELNELIERLQPEQQHITSILVLDKTRKITTEELIQSVYPVLKKAMPAVKIGYGTDGFFADLNRNRPGNCLYDFVCFSLSPQVHAVDTRSIIENLEAQPDTIKTAQTFIGDKLIHVSPVTFKMRTGGEAATAQHKPSEPASDVDERFDTWFAAQWTLQTIKNLGKAARITLYETKGLKGIIKESEFLANVTEQSEDVLLTPVYKVLAAIKAFKAVSIVKQNNDSNNTFMIENRQGNRLMFICDSMPSSNL